MPSVQRGLRHPAVLAVGRGGDGGYAAPAPGAPYVVPGRDSPDLMMETMDRIWSFAKGGGNAQWIIEQIEEHLNTRHDQVGSQQRFDRGPFRRHNTNAQRGGFQHGSIICALTHSHNQPSTESINIRTLLLLFIAWRQPGCSKVELLVDASLAPVGICCQQMDLEMIPDGCNASINAIYQNPVYRQGAVDVCDQMLGSQDAPPRDTQLDHFIYYTVDLGSKASVAEKVDI